VSIYVAENSGQNEAGQNEAGLYPENAPTANQRHDSQFRHARLHSVMVRCLKAALPVLAVGLVVWFVGLSYFKTSPAEQFSAENSGIKDGKLIMEAPRVKGYNASNQPYDLNAKRAVQDLKKPDIVLLELIDAMLPAGEGDFADIDANSGTYNSAKEWLSLDKDIVINRKDGTVIKLDSAEINLKSGKLVSKDPVNVTTTTSTISADGLEVIDSGDTVVFNKRVRMTIQPAADSE